jgi:hypothetical protein
VELGAVLGSFVAGAIEVKACKMVRFAGPSGRDRSRNIATDKRLGVSITGKEATFRSRSREILWGLQEVERSFPMEFDGMLGRAGVPLHPIK